MFNIRWPRQDRRARESYRYKPRTSLPETNWVQMPGTECEPQAPTYEELEAQVEMLNGVVEVHADTYRAAIHLIGVLGMTSATGVPVFVLNSEQHEESNISLLRHAVIDLQATLEGSEIPELVLNGRILQ